jgi:hypothetical protein
MQNVWIRFILLNCDILLKYRYTCLKVMACRMVIIYQLFAGTTYICFNHEYENQKFLPECGTYLPEFIESIFRNT